MLHFVQDLPNAEVYGNGRSVTYFFVIFSVAFLLFIWMVPAENQKSHMLIAMVFIINLNLFVSLPLLNILKNVKLRNFAAKKLNSIKKILKFEAFSRSTQVSPA